MRFDKNKVFHHVTLKKDAEDFSEMAASLLLHMVL